MRQISKALCWAAIIIGFAVAGRAGLVSDDLSQVMLIALPVLAWLSIVSSPKCAPCPVSLRGEKS